MSDEEDHSAEEGRPMVIEVKMDKDSYSRNQRGRRKNRHFHEEEEDDDERDEDEEAIYESDDEDDEEYSSPVVTARTTHRSKGSNGRKRVDMTPPDKLLKISRKKANKFLDAGKVDKGIRELVRCVAFTRMVYGAQDWRLCRCHADLADAYFNHKNLSPQAEYHADIGITILLNHPPTITTEKEKADVYSVLFRLYYTKGKALTILKKYPDADVALGKAGKFLDDLMKISTVSHEECTEMEIDLAHAKARLYWRQKKYAVAGSQYDQLLDMMETYYGKDSLELVPVYQEQGQLEQSRGRHADHNRAIEAYLQAHSIAGANCKDDNILLVDTGLSLARAYSQTGREEAEDLAEKYLNETLTTCQSHYGSDHKKTLEVMDELARLLIRVNRHEEALSLLRSSLPGKSDIFGDYSEEMSDTYKLMASVHLATGNTEKSLRAYKKCHNIECLVLGKNHKKAKDTERTIDILLASPGLSSKFSLSKEDDLKKRPKFNAIVNRSKPVNNSTV